MRPTKCFSFFFFFFFFPTLTNLCAFAKLAVEIDLPLPSRRLHDVVYEGGIVQDGVDELFRWLPAATKGTRLAVQGKSAKETRAHE